MNKRTLSGKGKNALLSVYDKTGITDFAQTLVTLGWNIYSSGGTAKALTTAGIPVTDVSDLVGGGAILDHRVVTLSREIHAGLLATDTAEDLAELESLGVPYIDLVCVDLYPLAEAIAEQGATTESVVKQTDIGGPTMLRSAAKGRRIVIGRPQERKEVLDWLNDGEPEGDAFRNMLAATAEFVVSSYVLLSARYHSDRKYDGLIGELVGACKYGENPYMQPAELFHTDTDDPLALHRFIAVEGAERSFINLTDADCLLQALTHIAAGFEQNFGSVPHMAVGVKHGNACGAAVGDSPIDVIRRMVAGDKRAIFGGVIMTNFAITRDVAEALMERDETDPPRLFDGIFAPSFSIDAPEVLKRFQGKCRMMANPALDTLSANSLDTTTRYRQVRGGFLTQPNYTFVLDLAQSTVHGKKLSVQQKRDIVLAWAIGCISNSNTITLVHDGQLLGNGVGQQDRVGACELAIKRATDAGHITKGAVAWSDSFFPAPDGPEVLAKAGVTAIFTTSGSRRDPDAIAMCKTHKVTLAMQPDTAVRGFAKH